MKKKVDAYYLENKRMIELMNILTEWGYDDIKAKRYAFEAIYQTHICDLPVPDGQEASCQSVHRRA